VTLRGALVAALLSAATVTALGALAVKSVPYPHSTLAVR
jgi:hypothetical protein